MEPNIEEALRAKLNAEKLFSVKDFTGAKRSAMKAQAFYPQLEGIAHMVATFNIFAALETRINGEINFYSVLGLDPSANKSAVKKQYRKMAVLLHPDKNKTVGSDEAFRLVSDAWTVLSDNAKRGSYDARRTSHLVAPSNPPVSGRLDTFWTVCTSCRVQYEYLRKYVNKRLSCKNCRGVFVAVETGAAPVTYCPWTYNNGYANHSYNPASYGSSGFGSAQAHRPECTTFQWGSSIPDPNVNGFSYNSPNVVSESPTVRLGRPPKKQKIEPGDAPRNGSRPEPELSASNVNGNGNSITESLTRAFDARKLLIEKARSVIRANLEQMKLVLKAEKNVKTMKKTITVPDPDFHDFDTDRSEEVFKAKQIWAIYDEEDGMPRLYCLIRQVLSVNPFRVYISYLNSKTDTEFGSVKWIESGFTKSCGSFRVFHSDVVDQVNIFSHLLGREKAGRGGCVRIYPKTGDIWAVYRNWSEKWTRKTPKEVVHQYEVVEVLGDYSDENGVCVAPLVKLDGFKTVYQRDPNGLAVQWVPRREMVRFSHQVPSCVLKGRGLNLPDGCWDLDPAATPEELLEAAIMEENGAAPASFSH